MQAAEKTDAEVIDVRSLSPIDWDTIGASVQKTGRAVIVEEGPITGGVGAELAAGIAERWPATRIRRVASPDVPAPFTPVLENAYRPDVQRIKDSLRSILERSHG
jgi:pyruvate dehydrogenase E1 component beta subunit